MSYAMTTQKQVRESFWTSFPEFIDQYRAYKRQKDYNADIRCAFVGHVDSLQKDGQISDKLANRVTL